MSTRWAVAAAVVAALALPAVAEAQVRSGTVGDGQDQPLEISGANTPDVERLKVSYDTAGTVTATITLFDSYANAKPSGWSGSTLRLVVGSGGAGGQCDLDGTDTGSTVTFEGSVDAATAVTAAIGGVEGTAPVQIVPSDDQRSFTLTFTHALLADRDLRCFTLRWHNRGTDADQIDNVPDGGAAAYFRGHLPPVPIPTLSVVYARHYAATAIDRRFGIRPDFRGFLCHRLSRTRIWCPVGWNRMRRRADGEIASWYSWTGRITIWHVRRGRQIWWDYSYRLARNNLLCDPWVRSRCQRIIVVR